MAAHANGSNVAVPAVDPRRNVAEFSGHLLRFHVVPRQSVLLELQPTTLGLGLLVLTACVSGTSGVDASTSAATSPTGTSSLETSDTSGGDETASAGSTTSAADEATTSSQCEDHGACLDALAPICDMGRCRPCGDAPPDACGVRDPADPVCLGSGACGECTGDQDEACTGTTPVCDLVANVCVGCTGHEQCPNTACDSATGACFPGDCAVRVADDGSADFSDISSAVAAIPEDGSCVVTLTNPNDDTLLLEHVTVSDGRRVALIGEGEPLRWGSGTGVAIMVGADSVAYVDRVRFISRLEAIDGTLRLDRVDLAPGAVPAAVRADGDAARVFLSNSWISTIAVGPALQVDGGNVEVVYSTLYGGTSAVACGAAQTITLRASLLLSRGTMDPIDCVGADISYSASEMVYAGPGNQSLGPNQVDWFQILPFPRLASDPPVLLGATARWTTGDPVIDIEGRPRPSIDGTMTFAGAESLR